MSTFYTSREIPAPIEEVFAAISESTRLECWWGPSGFTNTFKVCEFKTGGRWSFVMHAPNGNNYRNESVFVEIEPLKKVVVQHISEPKFRLTIGLTSTVTGTLVSWSQAFEDPNVAKQIEHIVVPANEQNLDHLTSEALSPSDNLMSILTPRAQKLLDLSREEARHLNHEFVSSEHLLLALLTLGQGTAFNVLRNQGLDLNFVRNEVKKQAGTHRDNKTIGC